MWKVLLIGLLVVSATAGRGNRKGKGKGKADGTVGQIDDTVGDQDHGTHDQDHGSHDQDRGSHDCDKHGSRDNDHGSHGHDSNDHDNHHDSGSHEDEEPLHGDEFQAVVADLKEHFLHAANVTGDMSMLAADANYEVELNGSYAKWDTLRHDFDRLGRESAMSFMAAESKLWDMTEKLYTRPGDFNKSHTCVALWDHVNANRNEAGEFQFDPATTVNGALQAVEYDIGCFHMLYMEANAIPEDTSHMAMEDAFDLVTEIYRRVFRLKTAGTRFHMAAMALGQGEAKWRAEQMAVTDLHKKEFGLLKRLISLLDEEKKL